MFPDTPSLKGPIPTRSSRNKGSVGHRMEGSLLEAAELGKPIVKVVMASDKLSLSWLQFSRLDAFLH